MNIFDKKTKKRKLIKVYSHPRSGTSAIVHLLGKASSKSFTCDIEESMYDKGYNDLLFNKEIPFSDYI